MKKQHLLSLSLGAVVSLAILSLCFFALYLPRVKFYKPVHISILREGKTNKPAIQVYSITPLGQASPIDCNNLSQADTRTLLFSEIYVDLDSIEVDSISGIMVQNGAEKTVITKKDIRIWYDKHKANPLFPLSEYSGGNNAILPRLAACAHVDWWTVIESLFIKAFPFLIITLAAISFCALLLFRDRFIRIDRIIIPQTDASKWLFAICLLFFVALQLYGICFYKLRVQGCDAVGDMMFYSSGELYKVFQTGHPDTYRFAYILNKVFLPIGFLFHLPMSWIGRIYCLNDACFHLFIAFAILFFTRRYDLAAVVLAADVLLTGINFYYINNELFLSGSIMILYIAIYQGLRDSPLKYSILCLCLFFIIWSHPVTIIVLAVFLAGTYLKMSQVFKDKWILLFLLVNVSARLLLLDSYDMEHIHGLQGGFSLHHMAINIREYSLTYWYMILLAAAGIYISISRSQSFRGYACLMLLPLLVFLSTTQGPYIDYISLAKFTYPIHIFILMQGIVLMGRFSKWIAVLMCLILMFGIYGTISKFHAPVRRRVELIEVLNTLCYQQDPNQSKWYVRENSLVYIANPESYMEAMIFSTLQELPATIQILRTNGITKKILDATPIEQYRTDENMAGNIKELNPRYFHFKEGPYKELLLDREKLDMIRKACR